MIRGDWTDPGTEDVPLIDYLELWIAERPLQPRTRELYRSLLANHVDGFLSGHTVSSLSPAAIRAWRRELLERGRSELTSAKAYRLLRAAMNTAVSEDRLIRENLVEFGVSTRSRARSDRSRRWHRCMRWRVRCRPGIGRWCCSLHSRDCGGAS